MAGSRTAMKYGCGSPRRNNSLPERLGRQRRHTSRLGFGGVVLGLVLIAGCTLRFERSKQSVPNPHPFSSPEPDRRQLTADGHVVVEERVARVAAHLLREDGSPATGATVSLTEVIPGLGGVLSTLNPFDSPPQKDGKVDGDGSFTIGIPRLVERPLHLTAGVPPADGEGYGPYLSVVVTTRSDGAQLPVLRFWEPRLSLTSGQTFLKVDFDLLPTDGYGDATYFTVSFTGRQRVVFSDVVGPGTVMDGRLLEDFSGHVNISVGADAVVGTTSLSLNYGSASIPYRSPAGPPRSRGVPCLVTNTVGTVMSTNPCPLTDGVIEEHNFMADFHCVTGAVGGSPPGCLSNKRSGDEVVIDLGGQQPVSAAFLRHIAPASVEVATSVDGLRWKNSPTPEDINPGQWLSISAYKLVGPARFVRLRGGNIDSQQEVSIW